LAAATSCTPTRQVAHGEEGLAAAHVASGRHERSQLDRSASLIGRVLELTDGATLRERVDHEDVRPPEQLGVELLLADAIGSDHGHVRAAAHPRRLDERPARRRARDHHVRVADRLLDLCDGPAAHRSGGRGRLRRVATPDLAIEPAGLAPPQRPTCRRA
jgi:hypothetical protein